jgi:hypothetical protein
MAWPPLPLASMRRLAIVTALIVAAVSIRDSVRAQGDPPPDTADIPAFSRAGDVGSHPRNWLNTYAPSGFGLSWRSSSTRQ